MYSQSYRIILGDALYKYNKHTFGEFQDVKLHLPYV